MSRQYKKPIDDARLNPQPIDDCYSDLANAVVLLALKDYVAGEELAKKPKKNLNSSELHVLRNYTTANEFLHSPRLALFTRLSCDALIEAAHRSRLADRLA